MAGSGIVNLLWKFAERMSSQIVALVVSIVLARILMPADYGVVALLMVFITIAQVFVDGGFSGALIQKKDADRLDFSTVLYFSVGFSIVLYFALFSAAPHIADFYGSKYALLTPALRVLGLQLIIYAVNSVQIAFISRKMMFRNLFWSTLIGTVVSGGIGIWMALHGFGVWALVWQQILNTAVNTATLFFVTRRLPLLQFSWQRLRGLIGFGSRLLGASLLITGYQQVRALIIGKVYSASELALFDRGKQFPALIMNNVNASIGAVLFPKMASVQTELTTVLAMMRRSVRFSAFLVSPLMCGLAAAATPLISLILTDKWLGAAPFMQIYCVAYLVQPTHTINLQAIKALGRGNVFFTLEVIKKTIEIAVLLAVMYVSPIAIAWSAAVLNVLFTFINAWPNRKLLNYTYRQQVADLLPFIIMGGVMFLVVTGVNSILNSHPLQILLIDMAVGLTVYIAMAVLFRIPELKETARIIKGFITSRPKTRP